MRSRRSSRPTIHRRNRTRLRLLTGVLGATVSVTLLAACTSSTTPADDTTTSSSSNLARYYGQQLAFGSCADYGTTATEKTAYTGSSFECARLTVPLDYSEPDADTMQVAVLRLRAQGDAAERIGSLVINPGGPGGSGMSKVAVMAPTWTKSPLHQRFDLVGFDPRGVGSSTPAIKCFTDAERDRGDDQTSLLASSGRWTESDTRELMQRCATRSGGEKVLSAVGSRNAARDLDVLRQALGDEKLTYAGQSYGTRLGAVYAEMFPRNVRALVLDGAADPTAQNAERRLTQQVGFQRSFDLMAASCAQSDSCPLGTDPDRATATFQRLIQPLIRQPIPAGDGRVLDFNRATGAVSAALYDSKNWPTLIKGIASAKAGDGKLLLAIYDGFAGRDPRGGWTNYLEAIHAINCNDEQRQSPPQAAELRADVMTTSPFIATGQPVTGVTRDGCEFWPGRPSLGIPYAQDIDGLPDTLTISVTGDPATPYAAGKALADSLGGSLLTVEGEVHTVFQSAISPCVNEVVADYLIELRAPDEAHRCTT